MTPDLNSKRTRVEPIFEWLDRCGDEQWPRRLLSLVDGLTPLDPGRFVRLDVVKEVEVPPSPARLAWLIRNAAFLAPQDGRLWHRYLEVASHPRRDATLRELDEGRSVGIPPKLRLEGPSHADCLIECERAMIWIEGKRNDWLAPGTSFDVLRDQLARNLEAAWLLAQARKKAEYCLVICYERELKHHERLLIGGYRAKTWNGGWLHLDDARRDDFSGRIGTVRWRDLASEWLPLGELPELQDLDA
jgi:hypothetical protein